MRVIVCGGRDYSDEIAVHNQIVSLPDGCIVVHGGASGADRLAARVASRRGLTVEMYPADWNKHGRAAGVLRNQQMLDFGADLVIAFPGGRGTADMVRRARKAGIPVREIA